MIAITIGFPVYNVEKYIRASLESALNQDFTEPYEILVIDDKGVDASMDIVCELAATHPNGSKIRVLDNVINKGLGETRNIIIENAAGKYLYFMDSDDTITPDALSTLYALGEANDADVVFSNDIQINGRKKFIYSKYPKEVVVEGPNAGATLRVNYNIKRDTAWNRLLRVDFLLANDIRCRRKTHEDVLLDFQTRCAARKVVYCPKVTYNYLIRPGSLISDYSDQVYNDIRNNFITILNAVESEKNPSRYFYQFTWMTGMISMRWLEQMGCDMTKEDELFHRLLDATPAETVFKGKVADIIFKKLKRNPEKATLKKYYRLASFYNTFIGHFFAGAYARFKTKKARKELYS